MYFDHKFNKNQKQAFIDPTNNCIIYLYEQISLCLIKKGSIPAINISAPRPKIHRNNT